MNLFSLKLYSLQKTFLPLIPSYIVWRKRSCKELTTSPQAIISPLNLTITIILFGADATLSRYASSCSIEFGCAFLAKDRWLDLPPTICKYFKWRVASFFCRALIISFFKSTISDKIFQGICINLYYFPFKSRYIYSNLGKNDSWLKFKKRE